MNKLTKTDDNLWNFVAFRFPWTNIDISKDFTIKSSNKWKPLGTFKYIISSILSNISG